MPLAGIGPLTTTIEALATAVAAGTLLGGLISGTTGLLVGRPRKVLEARTLIDGYAGGAFGAVLALIDLILRYLA